LFGRIRCDFSKRRLQIKAKKM